MRNLLNLFIKYHFTLLYLSLFAISFLMLLSSNEYQRTSWVRSSSYVTGSIYEAFFSVRKYFNLRHENELLERENRILKNKLFNDGYLYNAKFQKNVHGLTQFNFMDAVVVNKTVNRQKNYLTINKGYLSGIKPEMGVIAPDGIVGIVKDVSSHFSTVIPIININSHVSVRIRKKNFFGTISWEGSDYKTVRLNEIPFHVPIKIGDIIETSGLSSIFPEGMIVGIVESVSRGTDDYFLDINVRLSSDFLKVTSVMVIENILKDEQLNLEGKSKND